MPNQLPTSIPAIDFELTDTNGRMVHISDFYSRKNVLLVLNRGFV